MLVTSVSNTACCCVLGISEPTPETNHLQKTDGSVQGHKKWKVPPSIKTCMVLNCSATCEGFKTRKGVPLYWLVEKGFPRMDFNLSI